MITPTVHCAICLTGYAPTSTERAILTGLGRVTGWQTVAAKFATDAGWFQRADGLLLCTTHAAHGNQPVTPAR